MHAVRQSGPHAGGQAGISPAQIDDTRTIDNAPIAAPRSPPTEGQARWKWWCAQRRAAPGGDRLPPPPPCPPSLSRRAREAAAARATVEKASEDCHFLRDGVRTRVRTRTRARMGGAGVDVRLRGFFFCIRAGRKQIGLPGREGGSGKRGKLAAAVARARGARASFAAHTTHHLPPAPDRQTAGIPGASYVSRWVRAGRAIARASVFVCAVRWLAILDPCMSASTRGRGGRGPGDAPRATASDSPTAGLGLICSGAQGDGGGAMCVGNSPRSALASRARRGGALGGWRGPT